MRWVVFACVVVSISPRAWAQGAASASPSPSPAPSRIESTSSAPPAQRAPIDLALPRCPSDDTLLPQPTRDCRASPSRTVVLRVARIGVETLLGAGSGAMSEAMGAYIGLSVDVVSGHEAGTGLAIGLALGAALGVAPGVWLGGYAMGGDGSFGWTLLGDALGTGFAAGLLALDVSPTTLALAATFPIAGSIAGYELSSHGHRPRTAHSARATVVPSIGPMFVGIAGSF